MKPKKAIEFLTLLENRRSYYKEHQEAKVKTDQEYKLAGEVANDFEQLILLFVKALSE